jgi:GT2 family glycosyltransferase
MLIINNDVLCEGPYKDSLDLYSQDSLYGNQLHVREVTWFDGWLMLISRKIWDDVGEFDEGFKIAGFEDADYCMRAKNYDLNEARLPFVHLKDSGRVREPNYQKIRQENIDYLISKHPEFA